MNKPIFKSVGYESIHIFIGVAVHTFVRVGMFYCLLATSASADGCYAACVAYAFGELCGEATFKLIVEPLYGAVFFEHPGAVLLREIAGCAAEHIAVIVHKGVMAFVAVTGVAHPVVSEAASYVQSVDVEQAHESQDLFIYIALSLIIPILPHLLEIKANVFFLPHLQMP